MGRKRGPLFASAGTHARQWATRNFGAVGGIFVDVVMEEVSNVAFSDVLCISCGSRTTKIGGSKFLCMNPDCYTTFEVGHSFRTPNGWAAEGLGSSFDQSWNQNPGSGQNDDAHHPRPRARNFNASSRQRRPHTESVPPRGHQSRPPQPKSLAPLRAAYRLLGLKESATPEEVRKRRRTLARVYHSDVAGEKGGERMKDINGAADLILKHKGGER